VCIFSLACLTSFLLVQILSPHLDRFSALDASELASPHLTDREVHCHVTEMLAENTWMEVSMETVITKERGKLKIPQN
jgi:hypothetical protein